MRSVRTGLRKGSIRTLCAVSLLVLVSPMVSACQACQTAAADGVLVAVDSSLGVRDETGGINAVVWPFGYGVQERDGTRVLVDWLGNPKAREGDHIQVGGGLQSDGLWHACGDITVIPTS